MYNFFSLNNYPEDLHEYLKQVAKNGKNDRFYKSFYWGVYKIVYDTIITQCINNAPGARLNPWDAGETRFKIIDRNTLQRLFDKDFKKMSQDDILARKKAIDNSSFVIFHPAEIIPPPYPWLKKEKWLWANEEDWKKYMETVK